jgi:hypothetical protein
MKHRHVNEAPRPLLWTGKRLGNPGIRKLLEKRPMLNEVLSPGCRVARAAIARVYFDLGYGDGYRFQ